MIKDLLNYEGPVNEIFMVKQATKAVSNNGNPYLSLTLQDNSGTLDAKMWSISDEDLEIAANGNLIRVDGQMQVYRGHPQLKINDIDYVNELSVDMSKYVPSAPVSLDKLKAKLDEFMNSIKDDELRNLTIKVIKDNYEKYKTYPAAVTVHHAYMGGLLFHSLNICAMAIKACSQYQNVSYDYMVAGSLLHDIGKTVEFSSAVATQYTTEGNLLGHISLGAMIVNEAGRKMGIDQEKLNVLTHMILAHHGQYEFGSPKTPMTAEAYLLHALDDIDAKLECLRTTYMTTEEGGFTNRIQWMENSTFFKPHKID